MRLDERDSEAYSALLDVQEALSEECRVWLKDMATWVKEEIDQDPRNPGDNYLHFLNEQTKVFAYQTGLQQGTAWALARQEFLARNRQTIQDYARQQWKANLFKAGREKSKPGKSVKPTLFHGPEK